MECKLLHLSFYQKCTWHSEQWSKTSAS